MDTLQKASVRKSGDLGITCEPAVFMNVTIGTRDTVVAALQYAPNGAIPRLDLWLF